MTSKPTEYIEGETVNLTWDNDELGTLMFGLCWPAVKETLRKAESEPQVEHTVRVTSVTKTRPR